MQDIKPIIGSLRIIVFGLAAIIVFFFNIDAFYILALITIIFAIYFLYEVKEEEREKNKPKKSKKQ